MPPRANPWASDFFEKIFIKFFSVCWQFRWSNAPLTGASKSVKSPTYHELFSQMSNRFKCKNPTKHNWDILSVGKLSYGGLFISIKLFIPQSPHLTGFFKGSQMLQPNSEYRSNILWMRGTTWMQKFNEIIAYQEVFSVVTLMSSSKHNDNGNKKIILRQRIF